MTYPPPPPPQQPGYPGQTGIPGQQPPESNLVWAILSTVLCCLPLGIVSIIQASKVNGLWASGQYEAAQKASADAKKWAIYGAIAGAVVGVIYLVIALAGGISMSTY